MSLASRGLVCVFGGLLGLSGIAGAFALGPYVVSQKGRAFQPNALTVPQGTTVTIVNDDADLLHHAYIEAEDFGFDSGDQAPGSRTPVLFAKKGTYTVQCGIHPRMKLTVRVE